MADEAASAEENTACTKTSKRKLKRLQVTILFEIFICEREKKLYARLNQWMLYEKKLSSLDVAIVNRKGSPMY